MFFMQSSRSIFSLLLITAYSASGSRFKSRRLASRHPQVASDQIPRVDGCPEAICGYLFRKIPSTLVAGADPWAAQELADDYLTVARTNPGIKGSTREQLIAVASYLGNERQNFPPTNRQHVIGTQASNHLRSYRDSEKRDTLSGRGQGSANPREKTLRARSVPAADSQNATEKKDANSVVNGNLAATKLEVESADSSKQILAKTTQDIKNLSTALKQLTVVLKDLTSAPGLQTGASPSETTRESQQVQPPKIASGTPSTSLSSTGNRPDNTTAEAAQNSTITVNGPSVIVSDDSQVNGTVAGQDAIKPANNVAKNATPEPAIDPQPVDAKPAPGINPPPSSPSPDPSPKLDLAPTPDQLKPDSGTAADNKPKAEELAGIPTAVPPPAAVSTPPAVSATAPVPAPPSAPPTVPPPTTVPAPTPDPLNPGSGATANTTSKAEQLAGIASLGDASPKPDPSLKTDPVPTPEPSPGAPAPTPNPSPTPDSLKPNPGATEEIKPKPEELAGLPSPGGDAKSGTPPEVKPEVKEPKVNPQKAKKGEKSKKPENGDKKNSDGSNGILISPKSLGKCKNPKILVKSAKSLLYVPEDTKTFKSPQSSSLKSVTQGICNTLANNCGLEKSDDILKKCTELSATVGDSPDTGSVIPQSLFSIPWSNMHFQFGIKTNFAALKPNKKAQ
ncbi:hypothetical protein Pst134EA_006903 [Puccinia striiformis f. sp. tritici]|uniref:hypothetical protein n=1 Tax=Puccinia striiformis f. sp. tritici TaxID=168172 RepID=UPI0020083D1C|nr:hypothetical protein Pst134EA_006903 [Puccinia striiformis f. sp. tritici]KAH9469615.1 hypothetical protein Pst134EA_006903 [Puccinia striiformis f. sp. tritici]